MDSIHRGFPHIRTLARRGVYLASLAPARTRTGTGTSPHTHETHARDHSRPAPTARPNGAARPRPWEPDTRAPIPVRLRLICATTHGLNRRL